MTTTAADPDTDLVVLAELTREVHAARTQFHRIAAQRAVTAAELNRAGFPLSTIAATMGLQKTHAHRLIARGRAIQQDVTHADCDSTPPRRCINTKGEVTP